MAVKVPRYVYMRQCTRSRDLLWRRSDTNASPRNSKPLPSCNIERVLVPESLGLKVEGGIGIA